jgi:hypothetical protein
LAGTERDQPDELTRSVTNLQDYSLENLCLRDASGALSNLSNCFSNCSYSAWSVSDDISARYFNLIHEIDYRVQM